MRDKLFLIWLHQRLLNKHRENKEYDFMYKLRSIIHEYPEDKASTVPMTANEIKTEFGER